MQHSRGGEWYAPEFKQLHQESLRVYGQRCIDAYVADLEKGWFRMTEGEKAKSGLAWVTPT